MPTPSKVATKAARGGSKAKSAKAKASAPAGAAPAPATPPATEPIPLPSEQSGELFLARIPGAPAPGPAFAATEAPAPAPTNAPAPALTAVPSAPAVGPTAAVPPAMAPLAVVPSAATPTEPTPTAPTQTTVASTAAVLAAPAPAPAAAPEQAAPLKETKRDRMAREQAEREATMRLLRKKGTAASDSSTLDMPSSSTPSSSSKPKSRPRSPPSGGSSGSGGGGKWDAEYPGKDPKLSGHLSRPFSPGWGDSRSLPPFMQEEEHSPVAEAEDEAFRLAVRSVPTAQLSGHLLSPRSRPRHGGFFPSDAYIAFVEEGELALRGDSPRPEASMMVVVRKPLQLATVDTMQIGPVSPGAPGTEQRQRFIQTYSGRAGENASSRGSASKRSSPGRPPTAAGSPVGAGGVVNDSGAASSCPPTAVTLRKPRVPSPPPAADGSRSPSRRGEGLAQQVKLQSHWRVGLGGGAYSMHGPHMSTPPPAPTTQAPPPPLLGTSPELGPPRSERLKSERARRRGARGAREAPQPRTPVTPATVGFRITVRDLCAYAVPDADGDGQSEPYVRVELLGVDDVHLTTHVIASASTSVATDSPLNPVWGRDDTMTIDLPPDTPAALAIFGGNWPFVRVSIYDRDQLDEDDLLGEVRATSALTLSLLPLGERSAPPEARPAAQQEASRTHARSTGLMHTHARAL